jgi:hypothetical protein
MRCPVACCGRTDAEELPGSSGQLVPKAARL